MFPQNGLPLHGIVQLDWNNQQVPYIQAENDHDLFVTLGLVHMHLRAGQINLLRQIAKGRLSEIAGPFANKIDHALRIIGFGRAAQAVVDGWSADTRSYCEAFIKGLNHYQRNRPQAPELTFLGFEREDWTLTDLVTVGRLASTDVNWLILFGALRDRKHKNFDEIWRRTLAAGGGAQPTGSELEHLEHLAFEADGETLAALLTDIARSGSNSLVVGPKRTRTGSAMIANDPHLGLNLPNLWVLAGVKSPTFHAVGMMIPGLPFHALGRNKHVAWGGTNARTMSSDLVDVGALDPATYKTEKHRIKTRLWRDQECEVTVTEHGPLISDSPLIETRAGEKIALKWVGHAPSDEMSAFIDASKASTIDDFHAAMGGWAVAALNILVADNHGRIGKLMAAHLPVRDAESCTQLVKKAQPGQDIWQGLESAVDLPFLTDPDDGFIGSANDRPDWLGRHAGIFFSPRDRVNRMAELINEAGAVGSDDLKRFQIDVTMPAARTLAHTLANRLNGLDEPSAEKIAHHLQAWDGAYSEDSKGALAFELVVASLSKAIYANRDGKMVSLYEQWGAIKAYLISELDGLSAERRQKVLAEACRFASKTMLAHPSWGSVHRLRVGHLLCNIPVIGRFFVVDDLPTSGSRETLKKRSHGPVFGRHRTTFGAQSRHVSDLSDPDTNWFVLFGGQDGWLGSANYTDQIDMWRRREYIQMPLTSAGVDRLFEHKMTLRPESKPQS